MYFCIKVYIHIKEALDQTKDLFKASKTTPNPLNI